MTRRKGEGGDRRLFAWITGKRFPESPDVREALLLTLPETSLLMAMGLFWVQIVAGIALWTTAAPWPAIWIGADVGLLLLRLELRRRHREALRAERPRPDAAMLFANGTWFTTIALGSMVCLITGDLRLTLLGAVLIVGFSGYIASRCAAFPRFALMALGVMSAGLSVGLFASPLASLTPLGLLAPAVAIAYYTLVFLNHDILVSALRSQQESRRLSRRDPLTGLPNRIELHERLMALCRSRTASGAGARGFAVLCLDLDGFKLINDRYGHTPGDWLLKNTAERLLTAVGTEDTVCRVGGDEFVILLPFADRHDAMRVADHVIAAAARPHDLGLTALAEVGLSVGIALAPEHDSSPERLLSKADDALYAAKRRGKGHWAIWSHGIASAEAS